MNGRFATKTLGMLAMSVALASCGMRNKATPEQVAVHPETTSAYAALEALPDWSGTWASNKFPIGEVMEALKAALNPAELARFQKAMGGFGAPDTRNLRAQFCQPFAFGGYSQGFEGSIEFLFTPGRVTLIWEGGMVRRIYTDGRPLPDELETSLAGSSVGHWEGQTLVVDTLLNRDAAPFGVGGITGALAVGENAHLSERIYLKEPDLLEMDIVLDAPSLFSRPGKFTTLYRRERDYKITDLTFCPPDDRSIDPHTGHQRFDMAPPKDLPPPPSQ